MHALWLQGVDDVAQACRDWPVLDKDPVDLFGIALLLALLQHRHPVGAMQLHRVIPFLIVIGLTHRLLAFEFVDRHALLVEIERRVERPDFLGIITGQLAIDFIRHLNGGNIFAHLLRRRHVLGLVPGDFVGSPAVTIVVAIRDNHRLQHAKTRDRAALTQLVVERDAQIPRELTVFGASGKFLAKGGRHFADQRVRRAKVQIDHGITQQFQYRDARVPGVVVCPITPVKLRPQLAHAGELARGQCFDTRVLEQSDQEHLRRIELLHGKRFVRVHQMRGRMRGGGPVQFFARQAGDIIECIRQVDHARLDERPVSLAGLVIAGGRAHEEIAAPEGAQIKIELALVVDEQCPAPLLLQHRLTVGALEVEVRELCRKIAQVCLRAPQRPAPQATERQLGQQLIEMRQHGPQTTRDLGGKLMNQAKITAQEFGVAEAVGGGGQRVEHQLNDLATDHRRQLHGADYAVLDHVLASFFRHRWHGLDIGNDQLVATPELRQALGTLEPVVQPLRTHHARRLGETRLERAAHVRVECVELFVVVL